MATAESGHRSERQTASFVLISRADYKSMKKEKCELESSVLRECLALLKSRGVFCWRQNTGAFKVENRFFRSSIAGVRRDEGRAVSCRGM